MWAMISLVFAVPSWIHASQLPEKTYGTPKVMKDRLSFNSHISQIIDDGTYVYIMADCHQGYLQVYDLSGTYIETVSFYDPSLNGVFSMEIDSDILYVQDPDQNIYVFQAGKFVEFISKSNVPQHIQEKRFKESSDRYEIRFGSVWRVNGEEETCMIQMPWNVVFYQYHLNWILIFVMGTMIGIHVFKYRK